MLFIYIAGGILPILLLDIDEREYVRYLRHFQTDVFR